MTPNIQKIIEEFDKKFYEAERNAVFCKEHNIFATPYEIKQFLLSSLNQIRQETLEEIEREVKNWDTDKLGLVEINNGYSAVKLMKENIINLIQSKKENI